MYNGTGLSSARGSGTSGFVQSNLGYVKQKKKIQDYEKELKALRENPLAPQRKPDQEIIEHERLHKIEAELFVLRQTLEKQGETEERINEIMQEKRPIIEEKIRLEKTINKKESHLAAQAQAERLEKVKAVLSIDKDYKPGMAFDPEVQEKKLQDKLIRKEERRKARKAAKLAGQEEKIIGKVVPSIQNLEPPPQEEPVPPKEEEKVEPPHKYKHTKRRHHHSHRRRSHSTSSSNSDSSVSRKSRSRSRSRSRSHRHRRHYHRS